MLHSKLSVTSAFLALGIVGTACTGGDGGGGGGGGFSSGVEPSKQLSEVTPAEAAASCNAFKSEFEAVFSDATIRRVGCTGAAAQATPTVAECQELAADCEASLTEEQLQDAKAGLPVVECTGEPGPAAQCPITIAQYDACMGDLLNEFRKMYASVTCDMAPRIAAGERFADLIYQPEETPASCETIEETCSEDSSGTEDAVILGGIITDPDDEG